LLLELTPEKSLPAVFKQVLADFPELVLASFGQIKLSSASINQLSLSAITKLLSKPSHAQLFQALYTASPEYLRNVLIMYYHEQPSRIDAISRATQPMYIDISMSKDSQFATDYAFSSDISIPAFVKAYVEKHSVASLSKVVDVLKKRVVDAAASTVIQTPPLNDFFDYLFKTFESYPIEIRALIRNAYAACASERKDIKALQFKLRLSPSKLHEVKQRASMNFTKLIEGEVGADDFAAEIARSYTSDPTLFSCTTNFLLSELRHLDKHAEATVETLARLVGLLVLNGGFSPKHVSVVFAFIKDALGQAERSFSFQFARTALFAMAPKLSDYPQFVFELLRETPLRDKDFELYERLQKVDQLNEPLAVKYPKSLQMHPILRKFELLENPPPAEAKAMLAGLENPDELGRLAASLSPWLAKMLVLRISEKPALINSISPVIIAIPKFSRIVFEAASFLVHKFILNRDFDTEAGGVIRRQTAAIGKLIGHITLYEKKPILSRFLDLKKILLYSFTQGRLYGVVPFVAAILMSADLFFMPLNPDISSILQVLASIYSTDCLKASIKQSILQVFAYMGITISLFSPTPAIFPDRIHDNFDFLMATF
jgi:CCR4-NOT transcription complex subunit 1